MAQFRAVIQGQRGSASRLGGKASGITARVNGWNSGVLVEARHNSGVNVDVFDISVTGGSNNSSGKFIGYVMNGAFVPVSLA